MASEKQPAWATGVVVTIIAAGCIWLYAKLSSCSMGTPDGPRQATVDKSPEKQAQRKALIDQLIAEGYCTKVTPGATIPKMHVTAKFLMLDFETKESFASVVYAYYFDGSTETDSVRLVDSVSGKGIGSYWPAQGGLKVR